MKTRHHFALFCTIICLCMFLFCSCQGNTVLDSCFSPDGSRELVLMQESDGHYLLLLKQSHAQTISASLPKESYTTPPSLANSSMIWFDDHVEISFSSEYPSWGKVILWFSGTVPQTNLEASPDPHTLPESETDVTSPPSSSLSEDEWNEWAGYRAIFDQFFNGQKSFTETWDAKGHSKVILFEDEQSIEFLIYDRESQNGKCGLYIHWLYEKDSAGSPDPDTSTMMNTFAYVYEDGQVVPSGKTSWETPGCALWQEVTGEN